MSECQKLYTEREVVLRERKAFVDGRYNGARGWGTGECEREAARLYPLKVTRPRVVPDPLGCGYWTTATKSMHLSIAYRKAPDAADSFSEWPHLANVARVRLWNDLLNNPTEQVDE